MSGPRRIISLKVKVQTTGVYDVTEEARRREEEKLQRKHRGSCGRD